MQMDEISEEMGIDLQTESLLVRAEQLARLEGDKLVDKVYIARRGDRSRANGSLQRLVRIQTFSNVLSLSLCVFVLVSAPRPRFPPLGPVLAPRPQRHLAEDSARAILPRACSFRERSKRQLQCLEFSNISANFVFSSNARNTRACVSNLVSSSFAKHFYRHSLFLSFIAFRYLSFSLSLLLVRRQWSINCNAA